MRRQIVWVLLAAAALAAQAPDDVFRLETVLVQVEVRATDRQGRLIQGLEKSNFELRENGDLREILTFDYIPPISQETVGAVRPAAPAATEPAPTRIHIETRIGEVQRARVYRAIRDFLDQTPQNAALISLRGTPFTSDKDALRATLDTMRQGGDGEAIPPLIDVEAAAIDVEIANIVRDTGVFSPVVIEQPPPAEHTRRVALEAAVLLRWIELVQELAVHPGKKMVVVFGRALRYDSENALLLDRLSESALRARVQFYTIDTRGLMAPIEGGEVYQSALYDPTLADRAVNRQDVTFGQSGLRLLAELTGGQAVVDNNNAGAIFERVSESLGGYYLIGYRPGDPEANNHRRRLALSTSRRDVRLDYVKEYRSEPAFSELTSKEKSRSLELAATSNAPLNDLPIAVGREFFGGAGERTILAFSAGIACRDAPSTPEKNGRRVDLSVLALAQRLDGKAPPQLVENRLTAVLDEQELEKLAQDPSAYLQFSNRLMLEPGEYRWRVVMRNETTGDMGSFESRITVPAFAEPTSPSSLLLTTRTQPAEADRDRPEKNRASGVNIGGFAFLAEAVQAFRQGRPLYMVFGVYHLPEELLNDPGEPRVLLEHEGVLLERPPFETWEGVVEKDRAQLHVVARLNTAELETGVYRLSVIMPDREQVLTRDFRVVGSPSP